MTYMAKMCSKTPAQLIRGPVWAFMVKKVSKDTGIPEDQLVRTVKGRFSTDESDKHGCTSLQGTRYRLKD